MSTWASWVVIVALMGLSAGIVFVGDRAHWWWPSRGPRPVDWEIDYPELAKTADEHTHVRVHSGYRPPSLPEPETF